MDALRDWLRLARSPAVVRRALRIALVVGTILAAINHGPELWQGTISVGRGLKLALTYLVPYCVSTYSSVQALRGR